MREEVRLHAIEDIKYKNGNCMFDCVETAGYWSGISSVTVVFILILHLWTAYIPTCPIQ